MHGSMAANRLNSTMMGHRNIFLRLLQRLSLCFALLSLTAAFGYARRGLVKSRAEVPAAVMLTIVRAEDERRWDSQLMTLLADQSVQVRSRAALAAGRIGD